MRMRRAATVLALMAFPLYGSAQQKVALTGTIKDEHGAVIPGAKVLVAKVEKSGVTDATGAFSIPSLEPGKYAVIVQAIGWRSETITELAVGVSDTTISVVLEPKLAPVRVYKEWDPSWNEGYSEFLAAMHEPDFCNGSSGTTGEAYRFLWRRAFDNPILVRLDVLPDGAGVVVTKVLSGQGGYKPGTLKKSTKRKIPKEKVEWFRGILESDVDFWNTPAAVHDPNIIGLDGAMWVTEGRRGGKCHAVERWSPETSPYRGLGLTFLLDLAELKLFYREVY